MSQVKIACILLCAGKSSRMGPDHKLLLKIKDESILKRTTKEITGAQFFEVIAVTGHEEEAVKAELHGMPVIVVHNNQYSLGMHSSIKRGIDELSPEADFFAVCLADQPTLTSSDYNHLLDSVSENPDKKLFRPMFEGKFGNPAIISRDYISEIMNHEDNDKGCAYLFEAHPDQTFKVEMKNHSTLTDIDTPAIFQELKFHLERE